MICAVKKSGIALPFQTRIRTVDQQASISKLLKPDNQSAENRLAGVAQLVEHNVANVVVVGSNPITRSSFALIVRFFYPH